MVKFSKDMTIEEALEAHPKARDIFAQHGMGCIICSGALMETIEEGAQAHGIDVKKIIEELNKLVDEK